MSNEANSPTADIRKPEDELRVEETDQNIRGRLNCMFFTADPKEPVKVSGHEFNGMSISEPENFSEINVKKGGSKTATAKKEGERNKNEKPKKDKKEDEVEEKEEAEKEE